MKRKGLIRGLPALLLAAAMLSGCGNTTTTQATTPGVSGTPAVIETTGATDVSSNGGTTVAQAAELGTVKIAVKFPSFGKTGTVGKAIIDERTSSIYLEVESGMGGYFYQDIDLIPDPVTGIATASFEMPAGVYFFYATAYDANGLELEETRSAGEIVSGTNSVVLTFATGDWQFVAADNTTPLPLNLTDGSGTPVALSGFGLKPTWVFSGPPGPAKAAIDQTLPSGWADYGLGFFKTDGQQIGPVLWSDARHQFSAKTSTNSFSSGWLNLDDPARSEALYANDPGPLTGQRMAFIVENGLEIGSNENFTIKDPVTGADLLPALQGIADSRFVDGKTMTGHFIEMTFQSETETVLDPAADCNRFWSGPAATPGAARSAAIAKAIAAANRVGKAAPGEVVTLAAAITVEMDECYGGNYTIDGDGDGDYNQEYLSNDADLDGQYDPAEGDTYFDDDLDDHYDYVVYPTLVSGDGDSELDSDWLTVDNNHNGRFDPADGDQYYDNDGDGHFDYTYYPGKKVHRIEQFSDVKAREFRARAQQANTLFTDFGLPPVVEGIIQ